MIINLYAIYDQKAQAFLPAFQNTNDAMAIRSFIQASINPETPISQYPMDYTLFRIGTYDDSTATFTNEEPKAQQLLGAHDAIRMHQNDQKLLKTIHEPMDEESPLPPQKTQLNGSALSSVE